VAASSLRALRATLCRVFSASSSSTRFLAASAAA
jgi:hypothetical protein